MSSYGVSFSVKYARELSLDWQQCFLALITELGVRRFRLMSYWDEIEAVRGTFDFSELDWQLEQCQKHDVDVTLCLGLRQPRYPECHLPAWATQLSGDELTEAVTTFNQKIVERYHTRKEIITWQLENEALNRGIGTCTDYSRRRLKIEFSHVKTLDTRPVVMSTSNSYGLPVLGPIPDVVGFSIYRSQYDYKHNKYTFSKTPAWFHRLRAGVSRWILRRPVIIHDTVRTLGAKSHG